MVQTNQRDEYYRALGRVVSTTNYLEHRLVFFIGMVAGTGLRNAEALFTGLRLSTLLNSLSSVFLLKVTEMSLIKEFDAFKSSVQSIGARRDDYLHRRWLFTADGGIVITLRNRIKAGELNLEFKRPSIEELVTFADDIDRTTRRMESFFITHFGPNESPDGIEEKT